MMRPFFRYAACGSRRSLCRPGAVLTFGRALPISGSERAPQVRALQSTLCAHRDEEWTWSADALWPDEEPGATSSQRLGLVARLTRCVDQLKLLAGMLPAGSDLQHLLSLYHESIEEARAAPRRAPGQDQLFNRIYRRHDADVVSALMALRCYGPLNAASLSAESWERIQEALQAFLWERIGARIVLKSLIGSGPCGAVFEARCNPVDVAQKSAKTSRWLCSSRYGRAPRVFVTSNNMSGTCACPPHVLTYILCELLKNACRATVEHHSSGFDDASLDGDLPSVRCHISFDSEAVSVHISDLGGGIPQERLAKVWQFLYTSCGCAPWSHLAHDPARPRKPSPQNVLAGYGIGLPMSRLYAEYFGGGLTLRSEPGSGGTEAALSLPRDCSYGPSFAQQQQQQHAQFLAQRSRWGHIEHNVPTPSARDLYQRSSRAGHLAGIGQVTSHPVS